MTYETIARKLAESEGGSVATVSNPDEYNGWTNRETWATALHIDNDYGTYTMRQEWVEEARDADYPAMRLADRLEEWLNELAQDAMEDGECIAGGKASRMMLDEIGSRWRVNYREIAENWLSES